MEPSGSAQSSVSKTQKLQSNYLMMEDNELQHENLSTHKVASIYLVLQRMAGSYQLTRK